MQLRVVDAGTVGAVRSQSLWHGISSAMTADSEPTLSFCRPSVPHVCTGFHRPLEEIDQAECRRRNWTILRRQIGGGPVYIDADQLFFQITLPACQAPASVALLYERLLGPAVDAFRALGLEARLNGLNDIAVADRKISGTGAGRIGDGVTVVGNVIFRFPYERMVSVLALPGDSMRRRCLDLMRWHVSSLGCEGLRKIGLADAKDAMTRAYARALGLLPRPATLLAEEEAEIERWEGRFARPDWLPGRQTRVTSGCRVKITADVWAYHAAEKDLRVEASLVRGRIESVLIDSPEWNGVGAWMSRQLAGQPAESRAVQERLAGFGEAGLRVAELLRPGLE